VAADAAFSNVVASGPVPEGSGQTSFVPAVDLTSGATYYWRAQASDATKGVVGWYSTPQAFTTVFPEDGTLRYTLKVHAPPYCLNHYSSSSGCGGAGHGNMGWPQSNFTFDGTLTISGDSIQYSLPTDYWLRYPFVWKLKRTGNQLVGSATGTTTALYIAPGVTSVIFGDFITNDMISGVSDNGGRFDGTFDGGMGMWVCGAMDSLATSPPFAQRQDLPGR
jgi:hypothetical protein